MTNMEVNDEFTTEVFDAPYDGFIEVKRWPDGSGFITHRYPDGKPGRGLGFAKDNYVERMSQLVEELFLQ